MAGKTRPRKSAMNKAGNDNPGGKKRTWGVTPGMAGPLGIVGTGAYDVVRVTPPGKPANKSNRPRNRKR